jgi:hypothetical protein
MRTIDEVYLAGNAQPLVSSPAQPEGFEGDPKAQKTTPTTTRVPMVELELTYLHNPTIFNGINKITQTIMSANHEITATDPKVKEYFVKFTDELGNSGSDITWEELLSQIYKFQCIYGKAWIENIWNKKNTNIVDWDLIDPKKMDYAKNTQQKLALDKFGKPLGYVETLPYDVPANPQVLPEAIRKLITLPPNAIFLEPKRIALIKLFAVGDGFYPIGLVEPIYKTSLRKLNIEEALANAIWRHGFPIMLASVGDSNHEPTPQQVKSILDKLKDVNFKQELSMPYYYDLKILEAKKAEKLREHLEYFKEQEIAGLGIPKPFATGGGEATNRATLGNQGDMFQLTLRDIINKTVFSIRKYMFKPICDIEGFKEIPNINWDLIGPDELDKKSKRMIEYVKAGIFTPEEVKPGIEEAEQMN